MSGEQAADDGLVVDIVDDAPPEDQNRKPLPAAIAATLADNDELDGDVEEVRKKAKARIDTAKKAWHDERREKEAAFRERDEAANLARAYHQRASQQQTQLATGETYLIAQMKEKAKGELDAAKAAYKAAYEAGDSEALTNAQEAVSRATFNAKEVENWRPTQHATLQVPEEVLKKTPQAAQPPAPHAKAVAWTAANGWFGSDDEMTSFALGVHQKAVKEGMDPTSDAYFERIDRRMREIFPEQFDDDAGGKPQPKPRSATVVASVQRSPSGGRKITLTQSQAALARRLGVTNEQYARELLNLREQANG